MTLGPGPSSCNFLTSVPKIDALQGPKSSKQIHFIYITYICTEYRFHYDTPLFFQNILGTSQTKKNKFPSNKTGDFSATGEKKSLIQEPRPPGWARNLLAPHPVRRTRKRYRRRGSPTVVRMRVVALVGIELLLLMVFSKSGEFTPMIYSFF